ncbi:MULTISPECIES: hypothetical protein [Enterovibrio]|uniref:hypothetical protein n=1 Tax=Enterovibrio TaxID=188143 RepID=UPI00031BBFB9|nr:hypothetical protein [Enterovibrio norvegicus]
MFKQLDDIRLQDGDQYATVESVRKRINKTIPSVSEEVKYGGILFSSGRQHDTHD